MPTPVAPDTHLTAQPDPSQSEPSPTTPTRHPTPTDFPQQLTSEVP